MVNPRPTILRNLAWRAWLRIQKFGAGFILIIDHFLESASDSY